MVQDAERISLEEKRGISAIDTLSFDAVDIYDGAVIEDVACGERHARSIRREEELRAEVVVGNRSSTGAGQRQESVGRRRDDARGFVVEHSAANRPGGIVESGVAPGGEKVRAGSEVAPLVGEADESGWNRSLANVDADRLEVVESR